MNTDREIGEMSVKLESIVKQNDDRDTTIAKLMTTMADINESLASGHSENKVLQQVCRDNTKNIGKLSAAIEKINTKFDRVERSVNDIATSVSTMQVMVGQIEKSVDRLSGKDVELEKQITLLDSRVGSLETWRKVIYGVIAAIVSGIVFYSTAYDWIDSHITMKHKTDIKPAIENKKAVEPDVEVEIEVDK